MFHLYGDQELVLPIMCHRSIQFVTSTDVITSQHAVHNSFCIMSKYFQDINTPFCCWIFCHCIGIFRKRYKLCNCRDFSFTILGWQMFLLWVGEIFQDIHGWNHIPPIYQCWGTSSNPLVYVCTTSIMSPRSSSQVCTVPSLWAHSCTLHKSSIVVMWLVDECLINKHICTLIIVLCTV